MFHQYLKNRNIYGRIEVCFPVYDISIKTVIADILNIQLTEDDAQHSIYKYLQGLNQNNDIN